MFWGADVIRAWLNCATHMHMERGHHCYSVCVMYCFHNVSTQLR